MVKKLFLSSSDYVDLFNPIEINLQKEEYFLMQSQHPIIYAFSWNRIVRPANLINPINKRTLDLPDLIKDEEIKKIYLISRENDDKFIKLTLPHLVYVLIPPKVDFIPKYIDDLFFDSWATIYDNYEDAKNHTWG